MKVLITAGPTREYMDPVRFLSNPSSGSMGIAIAQAFQRKRADVVLVLGPTHLPVPKNFRTVRVTSALEMSAAVQKYFPRCNAFIASAAVGDWRFLKIHRSKLKKKSASQMTVKLVRTPDILADAGRKKKRGQILVGFALETDGLERNALSKLRRKNLDLIVANSPSSFASDRIRAQLLENGGARRKFGTMAKARLAQKIVQWVIARWKTN